MIINNYQNLAGRITVLSVRNVPWKWTITARGSTIASAFIITKLVTGESRWSSETKMPFAVFPALLGIRDPVLPVDLLHLLPLLPPHLAVQGGGHCCWLTQVSKYNVFSRKKYIPIHIKKLSLFTSSISHCSGEGSTNCETSNKLNHKCILEFDILLPFQVPNTLRLLCINTFLPESFFSLLVSHMALAP